MMRWLVFHLGGLFSATYFALFALAFVAWVALPALHSSNSGEGAIGLALFALPWLNGSGISFFYGMLINACLLYLFGRGLGGLLKRMFFPNHEASISDANKRKIFSAADAKRSF